MITLINPYFEDPNSPVQLFPWDEVLSGCGKHGDCWGLGVVEYYRDISSFIVGSDGRGNYVD